ncbi:HWE histidine kinase domain-containing protein [Tardiphaga sp. 538_B7_N1_4]|uniref:HWE histidine kinase domain-containing protein n=1 Tax=Tardiphaga sp. 538_B7_N1_4 TaxID=3240778 RepID=UPI003F21995A
MTGNGVGRLGAVDPTRQWVTAIGVTVAVGFAFFLAARLGLTLLTKPDGVAVFWPASGVAAGALIALGPRAKLPVAIGTAAATIAANMSGDRTLAGSVIFALCNAGEALLAAGLIEHRFGPGFALDRLRHVLELLAAAVFASAISGIGGILGFKLFQGSTAPILTIWEHWFASAALGIVTFAPLLIGTGAAVRNPPSANEAVEGSLLLLAITVLGALVVFPPHGSWTHVVPIALLFPLLLLLTARCQPMFAAAAAFIFALTIVWTIAFDIGYFGTPYLPIDERVVGAQAAILTTSLCALALASLFAERREHEAAVSEVAARLEEALEAGAVMAFEWDARTGLSRHSENAANVLGCDTLVPLTTIRFFALVHPDDRASFKSQVKNVRPDKPSYAITFRVMHPDGREMWLEETATAEFDQAGECICIRGLTRDITERKRAEEHQRLLVAELDHRVKNVLARVGAVAMCTRQGSSTMDEFVQSLDQRIQSMAIAHELLSQNKWERVRVADIVRLQLAPYATKANTTTCGPDIALNAVAVEALGMVLHELVTNASKYGALSIPEGRVSVSWGSRSNGGAAKVLNIVWRETGGPPVEAPPQEGYGTSLICSLIPHELGGTVNLAFSSEGISCTIEIPLKTGIADAT